MNADQKEWIDGLRGIADWFERNPDRIPTTGVLVDIFPDDKKDLARLTRRLGKVEKIHSGNLFYVRRRFGPHRLDGTISRSQVCERVVTGTRLVPEEIVPAHEEEIVEWKCSEEPLLAAVPA